MSDTFSDRLLNWFDTHGRHDLPWQQNITPYRVWVSEIMLQQTQVQTVIGYYQRFMAHFPSLQALAEAPQDDVLAQWSGLGYYARARNLHASAQMAMAEHGGELPDDIDTLQSLPGIGRSTAAAILSIARGQHHAILDGNVKRVLARHRRVDGWPGKAAVARELWHWAEQYTPAKRTGDYTQAIMDLGATLCTRSRPACALCPVMDDCRVLRAGVVADYPASKPKKTQPVRQAHFILLTDGQGRVLLQKRPPTGIWGGLWSLPQCESGIDCLGLELVEIERWDVLRHTFSHFHLDITPVLCRQDSPTSSVMEGPEMLWYNPAEPDNLGLPAPVARLLADYHRRL